MKKIVKKIAESMFDVADEYDVTEATALQILIAAAGGIENVADFVIQDDQCDCDCDDEPNEEDEEEYECVCVDTAQTTIGSRNRISIPQHIIASAENVNGCLQSKPYKGDITVIRYPYEILVLFGDQRKQYADDSNVEKVSLNHLDSAGYLQFSSAPTFQDGDLVDIVLGEDGVITINA